MVAAAWRIIGNRSEALIRFMAAFPMRAWPRLPPPRLGRRFDLAQC